MKTKFFAFVVLAMLLAMAVSPVYADGIPTLPHAFYGEVDINGSPAPEGTSVEARGEGVTTGVGNNPLVTTDEGEYGGGDDPLAPKLVVQGSIAEGSVVTFYVNGFSTGQTAQWHSGEVTEMDLAVTIEEGDVPEEPVDTTDSTPPDEGDSAPPDTGDAALPDSGSLTPPAAGDSAPPSAPSEPGDSSTEPLLPPPPPSNDFGGVPVLWLLIGGAVFVGLIIAFIIARSRSY